MGIFSDDRINELRNIFFESAQEILLALNEEGLSLERSPGDAEIIRNLRRGMHTLKGDSAACGYKELSEIAHTIEDVLTPEVAARAGAQLADLVLTAADIFDAMLTAYRDEQPVPSVDPLLALIEGIANPQQKEEFKAEFDWTEYEQLLISRSAVRGQKVYNIALQIDPICPMRAAAVQLVRNVLQEVGSILVMRPDENATDVPDVLRVALQTHHEPEWIERKSKIPTVISQVFVGIAMVEEAPVAAVVVEPPRTLPPQVPEAPTPAPQAAAPAPEPVAAATRATPELEKTAPTPRRDDRPAAATENVIRVEAERIDTVLDLVGELIIVKSMLQDILQDATRRWGKDPLRGRMADVLAFQTQVLTKLQRSVMKIRMVPVEQMFRRMPRIARDVAKQLGREVNIVIQGENTDLDKSVLDALAEPMMHLIRNAVDHGIETPLDRVASGKPAEGTIRLDAYHQGNQVVVEISDDGRGIDIEKVRQKAIARGAVTAEQAAKLSDQEVLDFIFQAGLSTSDQVSEISGRGVGMDVVRAVMDRLKGTISVRTSAGQGTTFLLRVPLTLAIIKALLFRVADKLYAVPLGNVTEILRSYETEVHVVDQHEVIEVREEVIPIVRLSRMHAGCKGNHKLFVVIVNLGDRKVGMVVDRLVGEQELFIKALDETFITTDLVSGASVLGDGRVVLILNISSVVERLGRDYRVVSAPEQKSTGARA